MEEVIGRAQRGRDDAREGKRLPLFPEHFVGRLTAALVYEPPVQVEPLAGRADELGGVMMIEEGGGIGDDGTEASSRQNVERDLDGPAAHQHVEVRHWPCTPIAVGHVSQCAALEHERRDLCLGQDIEYTPKAASADLVAYPRKPVRLRELMQRRVGDCRMQVAIDLR